MKQQVIMIHGGDSFDTHEDYLTFLRDFRVDQNYFDKKYRTKGWKDDLIKQLGNSFEVIQPKMPNKENCRYVEWKIWFEKLIPFFDDPLILVGHSQGGIFLAKYLSENTFPRKILGTFLVAAPFDDEGSDYSLVDFSLPQDLHLFEEQSEKIFLFQSEDDSVVPFIDLGKYRKALPKAKVFMFKDRGHFSIPEFPEIVSEIRLLSKTAGDSQ